MYTHTHIDCFVGRLYYDEPPSAPSKFCMKTRRLVSCMKWVWLQEGGYTGGGSGCGGEMVAKKEKQNVNELKASCMRQLTSNVPKPIEMAPTLYRSSVIAVEM